VNGVKTRKPIATISFNSKSFLVSTLERLQKNKVIQFYAFVEHKPESDEKKSHIHVYVEPAKQIELIDFKDIFIEQFPGEEKPRKTLNWVNSVFYEWFWYSMHYAPYLIQKQESRKYHYEIEDFNTGDDEEFLEKVRENRFKKTDFNRALELIKIGMTDIEIAEAMNTPLFRLYYQINAIRSIRENETNRGNKPNHGDIDDTDLPF
jgi:hypothetical protein